MTENIWPWSNTCCHLEVHLVTVDLEDAAERQKARGVTSGSAPLLSIVSRGSQDIADVAHVDLAVLDAQRLRYSKRLSVWQ